MDTTIGSGPGIVLRVVLLPGLEPGRPKAQALNLLGRPDSPIGAWSEFIPRESGRAFPLRGRLESNQ